MLAPLFAPMLACGRVGSFDQLKALLYAVHAAHIRHLSLGSISSMQRMIGLHRILCHVLQVG